MSAEANQSIIRAFELLKLAKEREDHLIATHTYDQNGINSYSIKYYDDEKLQSLVNDAEKCIAVLFPDKPISVSLIDPIPVSLFDIFMETDGNNTDINVWRDLALKLPCVVAPFIFYLATFNATKITLLNRDIFDSIPKYYQL